MSLPFYSEYPFVIRPATTNDLTDIAYVITRIAREENSLGAEPMLTQEPATITMLEKMRERPHCWLVALVDNKIIGIACAVKFFETGNSGSTAVLGIGVLKEHRNRSVGSALIHRVIEWCISNNISKIRLTVWEHNNAALQLYKKFGFKPVQKKKTAFPAKGCFVDEIIMEKQIV
ncbi:N-acetyltransferase GCN5 [Thermincola ferriacetica]|uniref:N-acetyltransferase GCN5 n=1 Tax=Thermincola ferriacetica TaxID=281456 RepID=A0A0L6W465_9FIRM|nr:GNAT family N-acetyltransferase [Thermincola ferriacetica]KNZ70168.1 N-acetyltransferase GCN5 [Thermincola ferriacetica]